MLSDRVVGALRPFRFPGKSHLISGLVPREGSREANVFGFRVALDLHEFIQRAVYMGVYERIETRLATRFTRPGMVAVDVGANIGYYTMLFSSLVGPTGRVISYEPSPLAAGKLQTTLRTNMTRNVELVAAAVGSEEGDVELHLPPPDAPNYTPTLLSQSGSERVRVPVVKLDRELDRRGVDTVDILKVDVEGYEPKVLEGARTSLAEGRIRSVLAEFNEEWLVRAGSSSKALWAWLADLGFVDQARPYPPTTPLETRLLVHRGTRKQ